MTKRHHSGTSKPILVRLEEDTQADESLENGDASRRHAQLVDLLGLAHLQAGNWAVVIRFSESTTLTELVLIDEIGRVAKRLVGALRSRLALVGQDGALGLVLEELIDVCAVIQVV